MGELSRERFLTWLNPRLPEISIGGDAQLMAAQTNAKDAADEVDEVDANIQAAADTLGITYEEA